MQSGPLRGSRAEDGMRFLNFDDMGLRPKLATLITVLGAPLVVLVAILFMNSNDAVSVVGSERKGLTYIADGPMELMYEVQRHRLLTAAVNSGENDLRGELDASRAKIDDQVARMERMDAGGDEKTAELAKSVKPLWEKVKTSSNLSPDDQLNVQTNLIENSLIPLVYSVANNSRLYRDPEVVTLNTSLGINLDLVRAAEARSRATAHVAAIRFGGTGAWTPSNRERAAAQLEAAELSRASMLRWFDNAMAEDEGFRASLTNAVAASTVSDRRVTDLIKAAMFEDGFVDVAGIVTAGQSAISTNEALYDAGATAVGGALGERKSAARSDQIFIVGFSLVMLIAGISIASGFAMSISRPMRHLAEVADQMSMGNLDVQIDVESKNEIGQLAESLRRMQASLTGAMERLRQRKAA